MRYNWIISNFIRQAIVIDGTPMSAILDDSYKTKSLLNHFV